jgi:hypothetical protein
MSFLTLSGYAQLPTYVPTNGLVAFYPMNGNANDEGPFAMHGTLNGPYGTTDRYLNSNSALSFSNSYIYVPASAYFNTGTGLSISVWANFTSSGLNQKIAGATNGSFNSGYIFGVQNNQVYPEVWDNAGSHFTFNAGSLSTGAWDHMVITWQSGGYLVVYVNGYAVDSIAASANPIGANSEPFIIGVSPWSQSPTYLAVYGDMDDLGIWNRPLAASEVLALYQGIPQGLEEHGMDAGITLYPNPAADGLSIHRANNSSHLPYRITDALGRTVATGEITSENTSLDIHSLRAGMYFLRIDDSKGTTLKFVRME